MFLPTARQTCTPAAMFLGYLDRPAPRTTHGRMPPGRRRARTGRPRGQTFFLPAKISTGRDAIARRHDRARRGASWSDRVSEIGELWLQLYICAAEMMKLLATFVGELPRNRTTFFDVALGLGLDMVGFEFVACRECVNHRRRHFGAFLGCKFHVLFSLEQLRSTGQQFTSSVKAMS
jgi:hypothetical protein